MKKTIALLFAVLMMFSVVSVVAFAEGEEETPVPETVTVKFDTRNDAEAVIVTIDKFGFVEAPAADPEKEGYDFIGWYDNSTCRAFDFAKDVSEDTIIYARWQRTGSNGLLFENFDILNLFSMLQQLFVKYFDFVAIFRPLFYVP